MTRLHQRRSLHAAVIWLLAAALSAAAVRLAVAEDAAGAADAAAAQPAPATSAAPAAGSFPAQPPPVPPQGFLNGVASWWNRSSVDLGVKLKAARQKLEDIHRKNNEAAKTAATTTREALQDAAQASKDAASAVVRLPNTRVFELRERCIVAPNGAPDCATAAMNACRQKGFNSGQPIDVRTSQECPATVLLSGRMPAEGECPEETVVLRAVCQ